MDKNERFFTKKRLVLTILFAGLFIVISVRKIIDYARAPVGEKKCDFIYPKPDETKPTSILVNAADNLPILTSHGGTINDASCLNKTTIYGIVNVTSEEDVRSTIQFANEHGLNVTSAGERHSMGGQSFIQQGIVLDMRNFNHIKLDKEKKIITVQSGAKWADIQSLLDKEGLSVKAMQSINIFTVGGTLSVNAHGIAHNPGQVAPTVRSLRIMMANGEVKTASRTENPELFRLVLGGYGLFGVILDAQLDVVDNELYEWNTDYIDYRTFPEYFKTHIEGHEEIGLMYARLSVAPHTYLTETAIHTYTKTKEHVTIPLLVPDENSWLNRLVINFSKTSAFGRWTRWMLEKYVEPKIHTCSRNQAMSQKEVCLVSRNQEMYDSMGYLKNRLKDTDILQEYFIPRGDMPAFVDGLREIVKKNGANLLNVTIRIVHKDTDTALPYAKQDMFAFVLYFNQKLNEQDSVILKTTTEDLIDLANSLNGTFYLPYRLYYSDSQLRESYPEIDSFFAAKKTFDPGELFNNSFYNTYAHE